jgi:tetratricopeptide (TPR) repeat protein
VPRAQADAVAAQLRERETEHAGIDRLLLQAAAARNAGNLTGAIDAALPLYRRVLALQPERIDALEGREDAIADLLQQARTQLQRGELAEATKTIGMARSFDPGHINLPAAESSRARALEQALLDAGAHLRVGRLERAADVYRSLLQLQKDNAAAARGLERVAVAWAQRAERFAADFRFADADRALQEARTLAPDATVVGEAVRHVARARQAQARLGSQLPTADRDRQVRRLLADAAAAEARGDLLAPPGDSAFDKLRAARAIATDDPVVQRASARLLPAARSCFERELRGNNLGRARGCLDALAVLEGEGNALRTARRRLASRWLAVGDERLTAGELQAAAHALATARSIDTAVSGLDDFAERLRVATAHED